MIFNDTKYNQDWNLKTLNQLGEFNRGKSKHRPRNDKKLFVDGKYPFVQTGEIKAANLFIRSHTEMYSEFGLQQSKLWNQNTLCITIAANIAETALLGYPMCFPDSVVGFNAYPSESSELFMHYVFTYIKKSIQKSASGSIQDNINIDYLTTLNFKTPDKSYQDKIVSVLLVLDSKIELNNRINTELEAMAKTLYDYWFVQFDFPDKDGKPYKTSGGKMVWNEDLKRAIPEGWTSGTLLDLGEIIGGSTPPREIDDYFTSNGTAWITPKDLSLNTGNKFITRGELDVSDKGIKAASLNIMPKGTILLSSRAPIGYLAISREHVTTNQGFKSFVPRNGYSTEYVYYSIQNMIPTIENNSAGSTFKEVSGSTLKAIKVGLPDTEIIQNYTSMVENIFNRQDNLERQNQTLAELRDWLLPMLMNGQVQVTPNH